MKQSKGLTADGRAAYGTGTTKTQRVYKQHRGKYVLDQNGQKIVVGFRLRRYRYVKVEGKRVKTPSVSIQLTKMPGSMTLAEKADLDIRLDELLELRLRAYSEISALRQEVHKLLEEEDFDFEEARRLLTRFKKFMAKHGSDTDGPSRRELERLLKALEGLAAKASAEAAKHAELVETEENWIAEKRLQLDEAKRAKQRLDGLCRLSVACLLYLADKEGVRAGSQTRRTYSGYLRNHILVPTAKGRKAIGNSNVGSISKSDLQSFERSLYEDREGFQLVGDPLKINLQSWLIEDSELEVREHLHNGMLPQTAQKVLQFIAAVVEWCRQEPERWKITSPVNSVQSYKPLGRSSAARRQGAPRTARFLHLVSVAEANELEWLVPLMALVRMTYRPSEARGLRWSDISEVHSSDDRKRMAFTLRGTIANAAGGEKWVAQGKTASAIGQTIEVPSYILTLLEKHRVQGCEYVVAPPKKSGKNSTRRTKPFATKHDVEEGWRSLKRLAEVPADVDLYTLKHGLVAELLLQGVKPEVIALLTRHTTINMVMRVYASVQSGDLCDAIDTMHASEFKYRSQST